MELQTRFKPIGLQRVMDIAITITFFKHGTTKYEIYLNNDSHCDTPIDNSISRNQIFYLRNPGTLNCRITLSYR